ncbi:MAG: hypothetical protein JWM20_968 [Patescibacteria group bacterium]|nr:hypothetical protein [Patescibacteria group bacterium]
MGGDDAGGGAHPHSSAEKIGFGFPGRSLLPKVVR